MFPDNSIGIILIFMEKIKFYKILFLKNSIFFSRTAEKNVHLPKLQR